MGEVDLLLADLQMNVRQQFKMFICGLRESGVTFKFREESIKSEHLLGWHKRCDNEWHYMRYKDKLIFIQSLLSTSSSSAAAASLSCCAAPTSKKVGKIAQTLVARDSQERKVKRKRRKEDLEESIALEKKSISKSMNKRQFAFVSTKDCDDDEFVF